MTHSDDSFLVQHIRDHSAPINPVPTDEQAVLPELDEIKSVVFDVYGTLFISGCGDISLIQDEDRSPAFRAALSVAGFTTVSDSAPWSDAFMDSMASFREARKAEGIQFPEVRIEEVWSDFTSHAGKKGWLAGQGNLRLAIVDFECRVNPCWPMPNLEQVLGTIRDRGLQLGIVSNAQFYTPLMFGAFLGKPLSEWGFNPDYSIWSYREREGKPSTHLYQKLASAMAADGLSPSQVLYVGNDLRNDIWPAQITGFRTALFAGDKRSLRWRQDDPDCRDIRPNLVITDLEQILPLI